MASCPLFPCVLLLLVSVVVCRYHDDTKYDDENHDEITEQLPGIRFNVNFRHYSGYLQASATRRFHYWYVESSNNPKTDPVVLWLNGGPGCSSVSGLLTEHGPYIVEDDGEHLRENPYSWNKVANMLYIESPSGVGYSYSEDNHDETSDSEVAINNHQALKDFFKKFPDLKGRAFYVSGESYGGIYVPTLSVLLAQDSSFNFKGFIIGNGIFNDLSNKNSRVYFLNYHGILDASMWNNLNSKCCQGSPVDQCNFLSQTKRCRNAMREYKEVIYAADVLWNPYNLYAECHTSDDSTAGKLWRIPPTLSQQSWQKLHGGNSTVTDNYAPCLNATAETMYLNQQTLRQVTHIAENRPAWRMCNNLFVDESFYKKDRQRMAEEFLELLDSGSYRLVVYNGDADSICNFMGNQQFVDSLELEVISPLQQWFYQSQVDQSTQTAGFIKKYPNLTFLTIKGAGHMVPSDKPIIALDMFTKFLNDDL